MTSNHQVRVDLTEQMMTAAKLAAKLNISRRTLQTWRAAGKLPPPDLRLGKVIRWRPETIERWIDTSSGRTERGR